MVDARAALALFSLGSLFCVACTVRPPDGRLVCTRDNECPTGWYCREDDRCYRDPSPAPSDGGLDGNAADGGRGERDADTHPEDAGGGGTAGAAGMGGAGGEQAGAGAGASGSAGNGAGSGGESGQAGRSGSGGESASETFEVVAAAPRGRLTDVTAKVEVSVSADVAPASVSGGQGLRVTRDGVAVAGDVTLDGRSLTFQPRVAWALSASYEISLGADVLATDGRRLAPFTQTFSVREGAWTHSRRADKSSTRDPLVALSPDGWAILGWSSPVDDGTSYNAVLASTFTPPATWAEPVTLVLKDAEDVNAVAINDQHHALLMWSDNTSAVRLHSWTSTERTKWGDPLALGQAYEPSVWLGPTDDVYLVHSTPDLGLPSTLVGLHFTLGTTTNLVPTYIGGKQNGNSMGQLAMLDDTPQVLWDHKGMDNSVQEVAAGRMETTVGLTLSAATSKGYRPRIAANTRQTSAMAVWEQEDPGPITTVWAARMIEGAKWSEARQLVDDVKVWAHEPRVAVDYADRAVGIWQEGFKIIASTYSAQSDWSKPQIISDEAERTPVAPAIALEPGGHGVAVWIKPAESGLNQVWSARYRAGIGWDAAQLISDAEAGTNAAVSLAIDHSGRAFATWYQSNQVWIARFE
ncbi:MAG: Ig-like domain-containing protein [Polyangiales bacterium]